MPADRIDVLARRVRWLDRYRRVLSIGAASLFAVIVLHEIPDILGLDWPQAHAIMVALLASAVLWTIVEVGLAWITAVWETECDQLSRDRGLPRAELRPPRKRRR